MAQDEAALADFKVRFTDEVSKGVRSAAEALEHLRRKMQEDQSALANLQKAMKNLQGGAVVDVQAFRRLKDAIDQKKQALADSQTAYVQLGGNLTEVSKRSLGFREHMRALSDQSSKMPGPFGRLVAQITQLGSALTGAQVAVIALGAAFAAATVAAAAFLARLAQSAVVAQDTRRNELLHLEALTKMRNMWGLAAGSSAEMQAAIDEVSAGVSVARDKVSGFASQLYQAGLRGQNLRYALEGASVKASALGDSAGSAFVGMAQTIAMTGGSVKKLSDDVKNRFGGVVAKQMSSLEVSARKQKEAFDSLFSGLHVEALLTALARLRNLFAANTESGRVMKQVLTFLLQPLIDGAEHAMVFMRRLFKQMLIGVGELVLAYAIVRDKWRETFGTGKQQKDMKSILDVIDLGRYAVYALGVAFTYTAARLTLRLLPAMVRLSFTVLTTTLRLTVGLIPALARVGVAILGTVVRALIAGASGFVTLAGAVWTALVPLLPIIAVVGLAVAALWGLYKIGELIYVVWREIDWTDIARSMWNGLVKGVTGMYGKVRELFSGLADQAAKAFKEKLGIASPSKVFAQLGVAIPQGLAQGVSTASPEAQAAVDNMIAPSMPPTAAGSAGGGGRAAGNVTVSIGEVHVHAPNGEPKTMAQEFRRELEATLEGLALQLGARPAGAAT